MIQPNKQLNTQIAPLLIWGIAQLCLLGIGASGFPLWAHHPIPGESMALPEMLCGQAFLAALLFPFFARGIRVIIICILFMLPMDELAGLLSTTRQELIFDGFGCVTLWMIGLMIWGSILKTEKSQLVVSMLATAFTAGGMVVDYIRSEASAASGQNIPFQPITLLPCLSRIGDAVSLTPWIEASAPLLTSLIVLVLLRKSTSTGHSPSTSLHQTI